MGRLSSVIIGFTLGNFVIQYFYPTPDYGVAMDRTVFQIIAVGWYHFLLKFEGEIT
jgi:hypothetical protein